ncbi:MAG: EF-hand domain-containing protein [Rivularia sp. (in: cyanobacteria)]
MPVAAICIFDGNISKSELEEAVKKAFAYLDLNQDGYMSPPELQSAIAKITGNQDRSLINMMFETLDVDGNGMVSMEELASLAMS